MSRWPYIVLLLDTRCLYWGVHLHLKIWTHFAFYALLHRGLFYKRPTSTDIDADWESKMEYDVIPHYLKLAVNLNNSADTNKENTSPTLQVNNPIINRPIHSVSSGNLAQNVSFKSFKNIQQSWKRSHMNSHKIQMDRIPGTSSDQNNLITWSNSNEVIEDFNIKLEKSPEQCKNCILVQ